MRLRLAILSIILFSFLSYSCKKAGNTKQGCDPNATTTRQIVNKRATVKLTATAVYPVYLVEEGSIDTKLIPCNFPNAFYQNDLPVIISGDVKETDQKNFAGWPDAGSLFQIH